MNNYEKNLIDEYNKYFKPYVSKYLSPEKQAEQFQIVSVLQNVQINTTENSVIEHQE